MIVSGGSPSEKFRIDVVPVVPPDGQLRIDVIPVVSPGGYLLMQNIVMTTVNSLSGLPPLRSLPIMYANQF